MSSGRLWITSAEASALMTETHGRTISKAQVRQLGRRKVVRTRQLHTRTNLYNRSDVLKARIRQHAFSTSAIKGRPPKAKKEGEANAA